MKVSKMVSFAFFVVLLSACCCLQALFDMQLSSIKHYSIGSFTPDVKVHFIVYRYAQLTASLLLLNADYQVSSPYRPFLCTKQNHLSF